MKLLQLAKLDSPLGELLLWAEDDALVGLEFTDAVTRVGRLRARLEQAMGPFEAVPASDPAGAVNRLKRYFAGELRALEDQKVLTRGTAFEERVWAALRTIPTGEVRSYGQIAVALGAPGASRAIGAANGRNPVALFVPCHRVIAGDGSLHGYGGGLERKRWLLHHEGVSAVTSPPSRQLGLKLQG
ncbi:MAG: methylated-DNA--[protein]-cysteine S-methyltransferase [Deltaproteobacteria bacterium]|nr:methylated-DNA--[protein]-cysteine S-methyltransferase [Deltaproteobacteria bacterium]